MVSNLRKDDDFTTTISLKTGPAELTTFSNQFKNISCKQDNATAGSLEVMASTAGTVIGITNLFTICTIVAVIRIKKKQSNNRQIQQRTSTQTTFYYFCNLAVADMLAGFLLLWIFCLQEVVLSSRTPISELLQKSVWIVTVWSSMLSQVMIAVDRYFYISSASKLTSDTTRRKRLMGWGIAITWLMPILMFVVPVVTKWNCLSDCDCKKLDNSTSDVYYMICKPLGECSQFNPTFTKSSMLYLGFVLLLMPVIPCVLYAKIYSLCRESTLKLRTNHKHPSFNSNCPSVTEMGRISKEASLHSRDESLYSVETSFIDKSATPPPVVKTSNQSDEIFSKQQTGFWKNRFSVIWCLQRNAQHKSEDKCKARTQERRCSKPTAADRKRDKKDLKLLHTLIIILVLFLISTIPLGVLFLVSFDEVDKKYVKVAKILLTLSLLNSLLNPLVYFWRFPTMRDAFCRVFCFRRETKVNLRNNSTTLSVR
ncbi:unnamed protein product [Clavelina lepadiformis]|uniref:G-protein coupled receptors family 1 profile domain-containing protein n=1 Tax=Clavelina lepadiformis TaxID=159417 RepID=A0ABP0GBK0_CLALP